MGSGDRGSSEEPRLIVRERRRLWRQDLERPFSVLR